MRSSKQIREAMAELDDKIQAITALSIEESRELSDEENQEIDRIQGSGENTGEIGKLKSELERIEKIEARQAANAAKRAVAGTLNIGTDGVGTVEGSFRIPASAKRHGNLKAFSGEQADKEAYISGQFVLASIHGNRNSREWLSSHGFGDIVAAMSEGTNSAGGFLVPDPLEAAIIRVVEEHGVFRMHARPKTMTSDTDSCPRRTGGLTVYYPAENAAITPSDLTLAQAALTAKKYATLTQVSTELNEDSVISVADELALEIGLAFAEAEDTNGFIGDGTSTYASVSGIEDALAAGSKFTLGAGDLAFADIVIADFEALVAKLPKFRGAMPCWFISSQGYHLSMSPIKNAAGGTSGEQIAAGFDQMFMGYPVKFTQVLPTASTDQASKMLCSLGDLRQTATMGTRRGINIASDSSVYFAEDAIAVKGTARTAITVHEVGDASNAGPMVGMFTPAS